MDKVIVRRFVLDIDGVQKQGMKTFHFIGTLCHSARISIRAENEKEATVRAWFGEWDRIVLQKAGRFEMDPGHDPIEIKGEPSRRRYRAIFKETTEYAVEFESKMTPEQLLEDDLWREQLDNDSVSKGFNWQAECAVDVENMQLEHLEEMPPVFALDHKGVRS